MTLIFIIAAGVVLGLFIFKKPGLALVIVIAVAFVVWDHAQDNPSLFPKHQQQQGSIK